MRFIDRRDTVLWLPALAAIATLFLTRLANLFLDAEIPLHLRLLPLFNRVQEVLAGMVGAGLAWRLGARRLERCLAGMAPVLLSAIVAFESSRHTWTPPAPWHWFLYRVILVAVNLLLGTLPFLLLADRQPPKSDWRGVIAGFLGLVVLIWMIL